MVLRKLQRRSFLGLAAFAVGGGCRRRNLSGPESVSVDALSVPGLPNVRIECDRTVALEQREALQQRLGSVLLTIRQGDPELGRFLETQSVVYSITVAMRAAAERYRAPFDPAHPTDAFIRIPNTPSLPYRVVVWNRLLIRMGHAIATNQHELTHLRLHEEGRRYPTDDERERSALTASLPGLRKIRSALAATRGESDAIVIEMDESIANDERRLQQRGGPLK